MIISEIRYDRVTVYTSDTENVYHGCMVSLNKSKDVKISVTGDLSSSWIGGNVVMTDATLVEMTPWSLIFDANMVEGKRVRDVRVVCEFNMFLAAWVSRGNSKTMNDIRISGNRVCDVCGERKGLSSFSGHKECDVCTGEALQAYYTLSERLKDEIGVVDWILMPSKNAYMKDYLVRMKGKRESEECESDS